MQPATRSRVLIIGIGLGLGAFALAGSAAAAPTPPEPVPVPPLPAIIDPAAVSARLIPVPTGCSAPPTEQVVFVGTLVLNDASTARFAVEQVRSGSVEGFAVGGLIDVRYGDETRFLDRDVRYIVGAGVDPDLRVLASRVTESAPLFGGNEIAGVNDSDVACPLFEDPVRTLLADNTSVESGVLSPLGDAKGQILRAVMQPVGVAVAILFGLVLLKHLIFALGRSLRDLGSDDSLDRERRHRDDLAAP
ncbi:MAG: hypothetical protein FD127_1396 [Acidimicrobiaceae bacterium]|jgi:hypothetical protein|nr:MAG: hypothetical protein FD127_1396 [Acidimicrobiaceae bacterium]